MGLQWIDHCANMQKSSAFCLVIYFSCICGRERGRGVCSLTCWMHSYATLKYIIKITFFIVSQRLILFSGWFYVLLSGNSSLGQAVHTCLLKLTLTLILGKSPALKRLKKCRLTTLKKLSHPGPQQDVK